MRIFQGCKLTQCKEHRYKGRASRRFRVLHHLSAPLRHGGGPPDGGSWGGCGVQAGGAKGGTGDLSAVAHALLQATPRLRHVEMVPPT